jgi:hypothetical protein
VSPPVRLADLPDVLTDADLCAVLRISPRQLRRLVTEQNRTGRRVLPPTVGPQRGRRYLKRDVEQMLQRSRS